MKIRRRDKANPTQCTQSDTYSNPVSTKKMPSSLEHGSQLDEFVWSNIPNSEIRSLFVINQPRKTVLSSDVFQLRRQPRPVHDRRRVHVVFHEVIASGEELCCEENDRGRAITDLAQGCWQAFVFVSLLFVTDQGPRITERGTIIKKNGSRVSTKNKTLS